MRYCGACRYFVQLVLIGSWFSPRRSPEILGRVGDRRDLVDRGSGIGPIWATVNSTKLDFVAAGVILAADLLDLCLTKTRGKCVEWGRPVWAIRCRFNRPPRRRRPSRGGIAAPGVESIEAGPDRREDQSLELGDGRLADAHLRPGDRRVEGGEEALEELDEAGDLVDPDRRGRREVVRRGGIGPVAQVGIDRGDLVAILEIPTGLVVIGKIAPASGISVLAGATPAERSRVGTSLGGRPTCPNSPTPGGTPSSARAIVALRFDSAFRTWPTLRSAPPCRFSSAIAMDLARELHRLARGPRRVIIDNFRYTPHLMLAAWQIALASIRCWPKPTLRYYRAGEEDADLLLVGADQRREPAEVLEGDVFRVGRRPPRLLPTPASTMLRGIEAKVDDAFDGRDVVALDGVAGPVANRGVAHALGVRLADAGRLDGEIRGRHETRRHRRVVEVVPLVAESPSSSSKGPAGAGASSGSSDFPSAISVIAV